MYLICNRVRDRGIIVLNAAQLDDQVVGQAGDWQHGRVDKALMDTKLIRTVGRENSDAVRSDFYLIGTAVCAGKGKGVAFRYFTERNGHSQFAVLIDFGNQRLGIGGTELYFDNCSKAQQRYGKKYGNEQVCSFFIGRKQSL